MMRWIPFLVVGVMVLPLAAACGGQGGKQAPRDEAAATVARQTPLPAQTPDASLQPTPEETERHIPTNAFNTEVSYQSGDLELTGYLCKPAGAGPFPAATYNHGGNRGIIGGAPEDTCKALAEVGFVGFAPIRRTDLSMEGNVMDAAAGIDYVRDLPYVDRDRIAVMGFSRGGLITFILAAERPDIGAVVIMAGAPPTGQDIQSLAAEFSAPTLVLVAENDVPGKNNENQDHVALARTMEEALSTQGKDVDLIVYPPFDDNGHLMFFEVGAYWSDIEQFLEEKLSKEAHGPAAALPVLLPP